MWRKKQGPRRDAEGAEMEMGQRMNDFLPRIAPNSRMEDVRPKEILRCLNCPISWPVANGC
jgi:hypothetical protein